MRTTTARRGRAALGATLAIAALGSLGLGAAAQAPDLLGDTRSALEELVETRRRIADARSEWRLEKDMLESQIALVQDQIDLLLADIEEASLEKTSVDEEHDELAERNEELSGVTQQLAEAAGELEARTRALLERLPAPARERVDPIARNFPETEEAALGMGVGRRFMFLAGVLDGVNKFHQGVHVTTEVVTLPDGTSAGVDALYLGIAQGWYVGLEDTAAGIGSGVEGAWAWSPADESARAIRRAIEVQRMSVEPAFVPLPIEVR